MFPERLAHIKLQPFEFFFIATRFIEPNVKTAFFILSSILFITT